MDEEGFLSNEAIREYSCLYILLHIPHLLLLPQALVLCSFSLFIIKRAYQYCSRTCWNLHRVQLKSTTTTAVSTAQKHKTARFAVGDLAFYEVSTAVEHLTKSLWVANKSICRPLNSMFNLWNLGFDVLNMGTSSQSHHWVCDETFGLRLLRTNTKILCEVSDFSNYPSMFILLQIMISNNTTKLNFMQHLEHNNN